MRECRTGGRISICFVAEHTMAMSFAQPLSVRANKKVALTNSTGNPSEFQLLMHWLKSHGSLVRISPLCKGLITHGPRVHLAYSANQAVTSTPKPKIKQTRLRSTVLAFDSNLFITPAGNNMLLQRYQKGPKFDTAPHKPQPSKC